MRFAVPAALICGLILAVCYTVCRRQGRRFPWGKAVCAVLLVGWAVVTVFVTLLRSEPNEFAARQCNLQLFLAWREAYQRFTLQIWLNVLLNIALFVPLGVLLPLLWKPFRKWYAALGAGFGVSLLIELAQLFTGSGMCDVDDLFTNTLGAMLGWCAAMFVLALRQKSRAWPRYCALPAAFALALSAIFISYAAQPYGNLRDASVTTTDLSGVRWSVDFALDEDSKTARVYRSQALGNADADRFAAEFAAAHGVEFPDAYYYDDLVIYANHSSGDFLNVTLHDGTWKYSFGRDHTPVFDAPASGVTEDMLREELDKCVDPVRAKRGGVKVCVVGGVKDAGVGREGVAGAAFAACIDRFVDVGGVLLAGWFQRDVQDRLIRFVPNEEKQSETQCEAEQRGKYAFHRKPPCTPALRRARGHSRPRR